MASISERGKTYYARFMHNGEDVCKSTGETNKGKAENLTIPDRMAGDSSHNEGFNPFWVSRYLEAL